MSKEDILKIALVGGGPGGLAVLKMFEHDIFTQLKAKVVGVADINPQAPGILYARKKGIFTTTDYKELYHIPDLYLIIELTGINEVLYEIARTKPFHIQLIDHVTARLFWDMFQIEEALRICSVALEESEKKFYSIFETARDAIIILDEDLKIHLANKAAQQIFGYSKEELVQMSILELVPPDQTEFYQFFKKNLPEGVDILIIGIKKGGKTFPLRASLSHFTFKGKRFFTVIMRDQTHRQQMEEKLLQSEKMAAIGEAASYLMHEIKNPLLVIGGFAQQLLKHTEGKTKEKLEIILEEVKRLERLLSEVRDFTKPLPLEKRLFNLNELILKTLSLFRTEAKRHNIEINANLNQNLPRIKADAELIKEVLINVIKNAIEAMPEGGKIKVVSQKENSYVRIEVEDTGPGIPPEQLKEIFNPFFTTKKKGTGLGLTISYRIIKDHGGDMKIESTTHTGTKCIILLPL